MTLIELLTASTLSLVVIGGLMGAGIRLQTQSLAQQQKLMAQQSLRSASDLLGLELAKAGSGFGAARLNLGGTVTRGALVPVTGDTFSSDGTFAAPNNGYSGFASDSLTIYSGSSGSTVSLACCPGVGNLGTCGSCSTVNGSGNICTAVQPGSSFTANAPLVFVNPTLGVACAQHLTSAPNSNALVTSGGVGGLGTPGTNDPCALTSSFWCSASTYAMQLNAVSFRVNWKPTATGGAQRPRLQRDPDGPYGPLPFEDLMWDVEQMKVRFIVDDLTNPGTYRFYPDTAAGRPALDQCTATTCLIAGGLDAKDTALAVGLSADQGVRMQLQRRVRGVEVTLISRSLTSELSQVRRTGHEHESSFALTSEGLPQDGYTRRRTVFQVTPRNFALTEANQ
jgi:hypothetical protein